MWIVDEGLREMEEAAAKTAEEQSGFHHLAEGFIPSTGYCGLSSSVFLNTAAALQVGPRSESAVMTIERRAPP